MAPNTAAHGDPAAHKSTSGSAAANCAAIPLMHDLTKRGGPVSSAAIQKPPVSPPKSASSLAGNGIALDPANCGNGEAIAAPKARPGCVWADESIRQRNDLPFDVYARPYIPSVLREINEQPAENEIVSGTKHKIDVNAYTSTFAGKDLLPQQSIRARENFKEDTSPKADLNERNYAQHLESLLRRECAAKEKENKQCALYKVPLQAVPVTGIGRLWSLSVPGLREDSPLIEMGDTLYIRQLWVDPSGNLSQFPSPFVGEGWSHAIQTFWTGQQHNASVYSVSRVDEIVYLRVDGLEYLSTHYARSPLPMFVNVIFPLRQRVLRGQHRALLSLSGSLACTPRSKQEVSNDFEGLPEESTSPLPRFSRSEWLLRVLFPTERHGKLQTKLRSVPHRAFFDHAINYEQAHAVNSVCTMTYGNLPYLISGPPGTGKTKTLVEVAMQLLNTTSVTHLLICAPSEAAADTLALRLKQYLTPKQLLRLNAPNRADNEVPRELLQYCYMQDNMFWLPPFRTLLSFSVVVTSCRDAAMLAEARLTNNDLWTLERNLISALRPGDDNPTPALHWGALLLDEAAQATEVDILPAISVVDPPSDYPQDHAQPRLVMAGDEHQLGPRTASHDPDFSTSLFARLFARPLYANHPLSRSNVRPSAGPPVLKRSMLPILYPPFANLIRNYRSHPAILSVPSSLFYYDTLIPEAIFPHTMLQNSTLWCGRKWPVLYVPHTGSDEIERDNGGWYNISEARTACLIAQALILENGVKQSDVCIMSPFAAQVKVLRSMIRSNRYAGGAGLWDVNIGPVEAFQGLEKRVVIICTTRTRQRFVDDDLKRDMGLVHQTRKMNVALTRAKEALFVIGSPEVLGTDEHWKAWMSFCQRHGLVDDQLGVWKEREKFKEGKTGVLERALVAKEDSQREMQWPALGTAAAHQDFGAGEYDAWAESLRKALDAEHEEEGPDEDEYTPEVETTEDRLDDIRSI